MSDLLATSTDGNRPTSFVITDRAVWFGLYEGNKIKLFAKEKEARGQLINATYGKAAASLVLLDDGTALLTSISVKSLRTRFSKAKSVEE